MVLKSAALDVAQLKYNAHSQTVTVEGTKGKFVYAGIKDVLPSISDEKLPARAIQSAIEVFHVCLESILSDLPSSLKSSVEHDDAFDGTISCVFANAATQVSNEVQSWDKSLCRVRYVSPDSEPHRLPDI